MSGIAGWTDWQDDLTRQGAILTQMADTLSHRGPDGQGQWLSQHAALAHRRLMVSDAETGDQPMVYQQGEQTYAITYNGSIYNFRELRHELEGYGHSFRSSSDSEVLLHAYIQWGTACVQHLNGVFAFGLWDEQKQQILLARDHLGVKPLFYVSRGSALLFGSELKVLLAHPLVKAEVDADGLAQILTFVRTPGSGLYRDVHELRPAHIAICNAAGVHIELYWSLRSAPHTDNLDTTAEHIRMLLEDTVKRQMIANVPVSTMLSGGLDSSVLTALVANQLNHEGKALHSYSIDFVDSAEHFQSGPLHLSQDQPWATKVAEYLGTQHHTVLVDPSALVEHLLVQLHAHDIPMVGQMNTSLYLLFKAIKQQATVTLSGETADEIFGGYPWLHMEPALKAQTFPWLPAFLGHAQNPLAWVSADVLRKTRPSEHIEQRYRQTISEVPRLDGEDSLAARRREMAYIDMTHWLPFLLERKDRMGMAAGLEIRHPFGDHRLVEYSWNIPWEMKMVDSIEKGVLRRAFAGILPEDVLGRKKSAYPSVQNPAYDEATRRWTLRILNDRNAAIHPLINSQVVRAAVESKGSGRSGIAQVSLFERIILLNEWLEKYQVMLTL